MSATGLDIVQCGNSNSIAASWKTKLWVIGRAVVLLATVAILLGLVVLPQNTLNILWNLLIPILPASFFVTSQFWRGVCPLATVNQWCGGAVRKARLEGRALLAANVVGIGLLVLMVPARRLVFNENGPVLAATILAVIAVAGGLGSLYDRRAGFCNSICPVLPIERIYGQQPLLMLDNHRCHPCATCTSKGCLEVDEFKSIFQAVRGGGGGSHWLFSPYGVLAASLPGFIIGYFTCRNVDWAADNSAWQAIGVYLWIGVCSLVSYLASSLLVWGLGLSVAFSLPLLAAAAGTLYYWWAAPLVVRALGLPEMAVWFLRMGVYALLVFWLVRAAFRPNGRGC